MYDTLEYYYSNVTFNNKLYFKAFYLYLVLILCLLFSYFQEDNRKTSMRIIKTPKVKIEKIVKKKSLFMEK